MYGSSIQLSFEKGNIQETTFEQKELNGVINICDFTDLRANITHGNTEIRFTTTSEVISNVKSEVNSISNGVTYAIENTKDTIGNLYYY